jgi:hypothetical protein
MVLVHRTHQFRNIPMFVQWWYNVGIMKKLLATLLVVLLTLSSCSVAPPTDNGGNGGSTDTTAPIITLVSASDIGETSATIAWTTNEAATSQVEYGTTTAYGLSSTLSTALVTNHVILLENLTPDTTYHYVVCSKDAAGNREESSDRNLSMDITSPTIIGIIISDVTETSAVITWTTDESATSLVDYGTSSSYGYSTNSTTSNSTEHIVYLTGLITGVTYHCQAKSEDASGNIGIFGNQTFTTLTEIEVPLTYEVTDYFDDTGSYSERRRIVIGDVVFQDEVVEVFYPIGHVTVENTDSVVGTFTLTFEFLQYNDFFPDNEFFADRYNGEVSLTIEPSDTGTATYGVQELDIAEGEWSWEYSVTPSTKTILQ